MIEIDFENRTYICPYCKQQESFSNNSSTHYASLKDVFGRQQRETDLEIFHIRCLNKKCSKITVVARDIFTKKQFDIYPQCVHKDLPDYIPEQIKNDYIEAQLIIQYSPKASATLLRRCLQGIIRDFWNIRKNNLAEEIDGLKGKVSQPLWDAIDGLRKIGNIGAHMEKDINTIIDIDEGEANKLAELIELLFDKWYVARHDEEELLKSIAGTANSKKR